VKVAQVWNILVVRADMDEKLAYEIVKALFEHKADLVAAHSDAANIELMKQGRGGSPIPFHAGAKKYYSEKGLRILR
jgi:TRAP transporter TAXI family solute receptor